MRKISLLIFISTILFGSDINEIKETIHSNWEKLLKKL